MHQTHLAIALAAMTALFSHHAWGEDAEIPETPEGPSPVEQRAKIFPAEKASETIDFSKVAYFRTGVQKLIGLDEVLKADPKFAGDESVYGIVLEEKKRLLDDDERSDLAAIMKRVPAEKISTDLRRPWAGGIRAFLAAFSADDSPLFNISLQTSNPTEIAFEKAWAVGPDIVRGQSYPEFFKSFYHEVNDASLGAELFALVLEMKSAPSPARPAREPEKD
ncbi:hypothetical protein [Luteolibacter luteus]|uniref:Uncharacterized protein n=1 Tax=Luteolibacter luteus TaxID=2728835 RepID=A0A858RRG9_9BACT|nr:hypothetical protein [Luteolibacter luteus]QJE98730.1 hypothetical protein HHL09_24105 [Luteolibacter luteus]